MIIDINKIARDGGHIEKWIPLGAEAPRSALSALRSEGIIVTGPVGVTGQLEREQKGIRFTATLEASLSLECVRCLEAFERKISSPFVLRFVAKIPDVAQSEVQLHQEDCETWPAPEGRVDLDELAAEQIMLALPVKPLCREDCRGLCAACGGNKNENPCSCPAAGGEGLDPWKQSLLTHGRT